MLKISTAVQAMLDEEIQQIIALKRMAANPRLLDLMRQIVKASDEQGADEVVPKQPNLPNITTEDEGTTEVQASYMPNGLTDATFKVVSTIGRPFTIPDVVDSLNRTGFKFIASKPKVAVAAPLKAFLKRGQIRLVDRGFGSAPNTYEFVEGSRNGSANA
jgi:hypothetical protein